MKIELAIALIQLKKILNYSDKAEKEWKIISWNDLEKDKDAVKVCKNTLLMVIDIIKDLEENYSEILDKDVLTELEENFDNMKRNLKILETYEQSN